MGFDARRGEVQTPRFIEVLELGGWGSPSVSPEILGLRSQRNLENGWMAPIWGPVLRQLFSVLAWGGYCSMQS